MSFNVLVVPEDATVDHYVLRPIVQELVAAAGRPRAVLRVLRDPAVRGVDQALDDGFLGSVIRRYPMVDLFVLCVDRDGRAGRDASIADREAHAALHLPAGRHLLGTAAHQEIESWCLAGMTDLPREWSWQDVRAEVDCKERYFTPYAALRGLADAPGDGREVLGREAGARYRSVRQRCDEVKELEGRVREVLSSART